MTTNNFTAPRNVSQRLLENVSASGPASPYNGVIDLICAPMYGHATVLC